MARAIGLDFGTTNSAIAVVDGGGAPRLGTFDWSGGETPTFRSILYFEKDEDERIASVAGPAAIDRYLAADDPGRLVQSLKSFLPSRDFVTTSVFGDAWRLEALIGRLLMRLREGAEARLGPLDGPIVVGRPVRFAGAKSAEDEEYALSRLRAAYWNGGFGDVVFEYEPVAAAYFYEQSLDHDELVLIADFGGGTSDFSLVRVGPGREKGGDAQPILGTAGVGVAGDAFDGKIVRHVVAPELGQRGEHRSIFGRVLLMPEWIFAHLERWHHLSFLKTPKTLQILHDLRREAVEPEKLDALIHLVRNDLGLALYRAVERTKVELSSRHESRFVFQNGPAAIDVEIYRGDFMTWIWDEVQQIEACLDGLLEECGTEPADIDAVFLTGGSSFVPAVRGLFLERFGVEKLHAGDELTSVAGGLALRAAEL
ncbi:MAG: Hsp70 family protein [Deltaproteobacteria bacterium]|nr:Hsp70 family protein [Deltaproteobacteria bacterium]MBW2414135.1 Hsp70 family protein [Deltaproteobacteria bacterium]